MPPELWSSGESGNQEKMQLFLICASCWWVFEIKNLQIWSASGKSLTCWQIKSDSDSEIVRIAVCRDIFGFDMQFINEQIVHDNPKQNLIAKECQNWKGSGFLVPWPLCKPALHDDSCILNEEQSRTLAISFAVLVLISSNFWKAGITHKRNNYGFSSMTVSMNWKYFTL